MLNIKKVAFQGVVTFKDRVEIPLDKYPLLVVRGLNKDSNPPQANGAGKSLAFSTIRTCRYGDTHIAVKNTRRTAKDIHSKDSYIELSWDVDGKREWRWKQASKGNTVKYQAWRDEQDLNFRQGTTAFETINKSFPLTLEQFDTYVYLTGTLNNVLLTGSATDRHKLFEDVFQLSLYDTIYEKIKERLRVANDAQLQHQTLASQIEGYQVVDLDQLKEKRDRWEAKAKKLGKQTTRKTRKLTLINTWITLAEKVELDKYSDEDLVKYQSKFKKDIEENKTEIQKLREQRDAFLEWQKHEERLDRLTSKLNKIPKPEKSVTKADITLLDESIAKLKRHLEIYRENIEDWKERNRLKARLKSNWENCSWKTLPEDLQAQDLKSAIKMYPKVNSYVTERKRALNEQLANFKDLSKEELCQSCFSPLTDEHKTKVQAEFKKDLSRLSSFADFLTDAKEYILLGQKTTDFNDLPGDFDLTKESSKYHSLIKQRSESIEALEILVQRKQIKEQIEDLEKEAPSKPSLKEDPSQKIESLETEQSKLRKKLQKVELLIERRAGLAELEVSFPTMLAATTARDGLKGWLESIKDKLAKVQAKAWKANSHYATNEERQRIYYETRKKILKFKRRASKIKILKALADAYGPKGLRVQAVDSIAAAFVSNLNEYSQVIFSEKMHFSYIVENRMFSILVTRAGKTSDVRYLSGAEKHAFVVLALCALLPLIPATLRTNLVILDEIESHMSPENRRLFATEFLPKLSQIIPNIVIITPLSQREFSVPNAHEIVVVKKNRVSHIKNL